MENKELSNTSIEYYNKNALYFVENTINADLRDLYCEFEGLVKTGGRILDLGCGSGRDSRYFVQKGYNVVSMDPSKAMCDITREYAGTVVKELAAEEMQFLNEFDAIWACASLLHVSESNMSMVLNKIADALKYNGIMYASWKYGEGCRVVGERTFTDVTLDSVRNYFDGVQRLQVIKSWITEDVRTDFNQQWVNVLAKKITT